ncbi:MAG: 2-hydroxychromene-2-carboxylate isomerase [Rhodospirillales bacterium]
MAENAGPAVIEYFYSIRSSFTYLGAARLNALAARHGLTIRHAVMDLAALVASYGETTAQRAYAGARVFESHPAREAYTRLEYRRWSRRLGIPIDEDPSNHYGARELPSGVVIACQRQGLDANSVSHALLQALWRDDLDTADPKVVAALLEDLNLGLDGGALCEAAMTAPIQAELQANTEEAKARGLFGAPTYIYAGEPFFGQDRLDFLEEAIVAAAGR